MSISWNVFLSNATHVRFVSSDIEEFRIKLYTSRYTGLAYIIVMLSDRVGETKTGTGVQNHCEHATRISSPLFFFLRKIFITLYYFTSVNSTNLVCRPFLSLNPIYRRCPKKLSRFTSSRSKSTSLRIYFSITPYVPQEPSLVFTKESASESILKRLKFLFPHRKRVGLLRI